MTKSKSRKGFVKVQVLGNLGADPKFNTVKVKDEDRDVLNGTIAVNVDENTVQWFHFEVWGKMAKVGAKYLKKGSQVLITECTLLEPKSWKDEKGNEHIDMRIRVNEWIWLDIKK